MSVGTLRKYIVGEKWKSHLASRSRAQLKANARFAVHRRARRVQAQGHRRPKKFQKDVGVAAPEVFSLVRNPGETITFFNEVRTLAARRNVFVNLSGVTTITSDALAGLLATMHYCRMQGARMAGNVPDDSDARQILEDSGFRLFVRNSPGYQLRPQRGQIVRRNRTGEAFQNRFDQKCRAGSSNSPN